MEPETPPGEEDPRRNWRIYIALGLMGFVTALAQILFLRRGIVNFSGNEMGVTLGLLAWLTWVGLGSLAARKVLSASVRPERALLLALLLLTSLLPATVVALDLIRPALGVPVGQVVGLGFIGLSYALLLAPFCLVDGGDFTFGAAALGEGGARFAFAAESAGAAAGGVFFFTVGVRVFDGLGLSLAVTAGVGAAVILLSGPAERLRWAAAALAAAGMTLLVVLGPQADGLSLSPRYEGFSIIEHVESPLGSLTWAARPGDATGERPGARTLFYNGTPVVNLPDERTAEEAVHPALMAHPDPGRVLFVTSHVSGTLERILSHPVRRVDVVLMDRAVLELETRHVPGTARILADPRVEVIIGDGRRHLRGAAAGAYDVLLLDVPDPESLGLNRFYSLEFFAEAARVLAPGGLLAMAAGESSNYIPPAMARYLASLDRALAPSFPHRTWYPLGRYLLIAGKGPVRALSGLMADDVTRRRGLDVKFVRSSYLEADLSEGRMAAVGRALESAGKVPPNTDLAPAAVGHRLLLWRGRTGYAGILSLPAGGRPGLASLAALGFLPLAVLALASRRRGGSTGLALIFLGGFGGIGAEAVLLYLYQVGYGYLYSRIALLLAFYMAGLGVGALSRPRRPPSAARAWTVFFLILLTLVVTRAWVFLPEAAGLVVFILAMLAAGTLTGVSFAAGSGVLQASRWRYVGGTAYALDLAGAAAGALVCGLFLPLTYGLYAPTAYCLLLSVGVTAGLSMGKSD